MEMIADLLMGLGAFGVAFYCFVLGRRLTRLNDLKSGMGAGVAVLSTQVDELTRALDNACSSADVSNDTLKDLTLRAEAAAHRLELLVASLHDLPTGPTPSRASEENMFFRHNLPEKKDYTS